ncbi:Transcription initiation factor TFIID subunit 7 like protein [Aduncisulcus paluster]|uniref:Transcription initiation factor TFIID subunit 7 like protein n=1 Tax=Aduncisulcus paluster TaxID=2918883 RepID=A0ABQ5K5P4_9EUKA|nr:Transcription initiation factor TFIID subunit 7 like protein [Aduncisulcus paluster]
MDLPYLDGEHPFILKFPFPEELESCKDEEIDIEFETNARFGVMYFKEKRYRFHVMDLPTVVEAHSSEHGRTWYKIDDIGQVLIVEKVPLRPGESVTPPPDQDPTTIPKEVKEARKFYKNGVTRHPFELTSGLSGPTKHIRPLRFVELPGGPYELEKAKRYIDHAILFQQKQKAKGGR